MRLFVLCFLSLISATLVNAQRKTDSLLKNLLLQSDKELVRSIAQHPDSFRLQVIYTQINRDKNNTPLFKNYYFNVDPELYFNPASTVKLPLALLALEKINRMERKDITKNTSIQFDSSFKGQVRALYDSSSQNNLPSIAHYIKKAFLVSDNDAYNRLYQFAGQGPINEWLGEKGYNQTQITRQFMGFSEEQNRWTNPVKFLDASGNVFYTQPAAYNDKPFDFGRSILVGKAHMNRNDSLVRKPFDFSRANIVGLEDLQRMLRAVMFPEYVPAKERFRLSSDDLAFLHKYLSQYPSETDYPKYDTAEYYDSYVKFFFRNQTHKMPPHVRVFNKVGWSYGFLTDVSYVVDVNANIEYMLAATLYVNSDGIVNDNRYEYKEVGWPFFYELGQIVYRYELDRERKYKPDLKKFRINYDKRDPKDNRASLKDIDN